MKAAANGSSTVAWLSHRWLRRQLWTRAAYTLAVAVLLVTLSALAAKNLPQSSNPLALAIACGAMVALLTGLLLAEARTLRRQEASRRARIARHLNRVAPEVEESAELLLEPEAALSPLARLQRERAGRALAELGLAALPMSLPTANLRRALVLLFTSLAVSAVLWTLLPGWLVHWQARPTSNATVTTAGNSSQRPQPTSHPSFERIQVRIAPPTYTGQPRRTVQGADVEAEEGSRLDWEVTVAGPTSSATTVALGFADRRQALRADGDDPPTRWRGSLRLTASRIYQLILEDESGEVERTSFARLVALPDRPARVHIVQPGPTVEVMAEEPGVVVIEAEARDDFGVASAVVVATLATGTGERVEFREEQFAFDQREPLPRQPDASKTVGARFSRRLDLGELHLEAGSELFYFVEVTDNRPPEGQRSRSATQRIRVPGGRGTSIALGDGLALRPVPEHFRSQRQIIIDTEKLLAERSQLSSLEFGERAESIGFDQAALRHRYGNLLGLETENDAPLGEGDNEATAGEPGPHGSGSHEDHHAEHAAEPVAASDGPNLSGRVIDLAPEQFVHQHDSSEISTFFTDSTRSKLRACLAAMWEAERRLRTHRPRAALVHENEALQLLKEVQEAARVYVQRVGFEPPPLDPEGKRLTGELDKISSQRLRLAGSGSKEPSEIEMALDLLAGLDLGLDASQRQRLAALLDNAAREVARRSLDDPLSEISALDDLRRFSQALRGGQAEVGDPEAGESPVPVARVRQALWRLVAEPQPRPVRRRSLGVGELWSAYRDRLTEGE